MPVLLVIANKYRVEIAKLENAARKKQKKVPEAKVKPNADQEKTHKDKLAKLLEILEDKTGKHKGIFSRK